MTGPAARLSAFATATGEIYTSDDAGEALDLHRHRARRGIQGRALPRVPAACGATRRGAGGLRLITVLEGLRHVGPRAEADLLLD